MAKTLVCIINHMNYGGAQKVVYALAKGSALKYRVILVCKPGVYSDVLKSKYNIEIFDRQKLTFHGWKSYLDSLRQNKSELIIHTHNRKDLLLKIFFKRIDIHIHTFHSVYPGKNYLYKILRPDISISISKAVSEYLNRYDVNNILILNGIDAEIPDERLMKERCISSCGKKLLYVGRLSPEKGISEFLYSFKDLNLRDIGYTLTIIGDGEIRDALERYCIDNGLSKIVTFLGAKLRPWNDTLGYDVVVIPSHYEGFGLVGVEATIHGIPIIANDLKVLREVLYYIDDRCFFDINKTKTIWDTIQFVSDNYSMLALKCIQKSKVFYDYYSEDKMIKSYHQVYNSYLDYSGENKH
ncbi:glycosyltransferase family 4 protein [Carboxylicivirga marina]|uniref:glycosyltransferase family 4 protein n=1 Tax=Carboxylicivirga marina TaxID=2800988 RepID=UPI002591A6FF|nr:glycosyltransferase family 4 protein [uncultured Carboxylicivirga sp.]